MSEWQDIATAPRDMSAEPTATAIPNGEWEKLITTWDPLHDVRMATSLNRLRLGIVTLQVAWRCREDGRIEWRNVPMHVLTEEEYTTTVATQST